ncbi:MAG: hypothetical protein ACC608_05245 [Anaerofustis sp.]
MINKVTAGQTANSIYAADAQQKSKAEESKQAVRTDTIEISTDVNAATNQDGKKTEQIDIQALKQEAEKSTENLRRLVEMMLEKQGKYASVQNSDLDTETVEEAKASIAEDGEYGIKAVSERIAKFAINIAGYPPERLQEMRDAIEQGFAEAERVLGGKLPDICYQTYNAIKDKLDDYEKSCAQRMQDETQIAQQE